MELIRCFEVGGKAVPVSHLQYADDTILFLLAKKKNGYQLYSIKLDVVY